MISCCVWLLESRYRGETLLEGEGILADIRDHRGGEYTASLTIDKPLCSDTGDIKVVAKNTAGEIDCTAKLTITLKREMPKFIKKPKPQEIPEFEEVTFETMVSGCPEPEVTW